MTNLDTLLVERVNEWLHGLTCTNTLALALALPRTDEWLSAVRIAEIFGESPPLRVAKDRLILHQREEPRLLKSAQGPLGSPDDGRLYAARGETCYRLNLAAPFAEPLLDTLGAMVLEVGMVKTQRFLASITSKGQFSPDGFSARRLAIVLACSEAALLSTKALARVARVKDRRRMSELLASLERDGVVLCVGRVKDPSAQRSVKGYQLAPMRANQVEFLALVRANCVPDLGDYLGECDGDQDRQQAAPAVDVARTQPAGAGRG